VDLYTLVRRWKGPIHLKVPVTLLGQGEGAGESVRDFGAVVGYAVGSFQALLSQVRSKEGECALYFAFLSRLSLHSLAPRVPATPAVHPVLYEIHHLGPHPLELRLSKRYLLLYFPRPLSTNRKTETDLSTWAGFWTFEKVYF